MSRIGNYFNSRWGSNHHIGKIDTFSITHFASRTGGYLSVVQRINEHNFLQNFTIATTPPRCITYPLPFIISYRCIEDDQSELSQEVFGLIKKIKAEQHVVPVKNFLNQKRKDALDHCTTWHPIQGSENVQVTSYFYDRDALLDTVRRLKSEKLRANRKN